MSKVQPRTLSGFLELLPGRQAQFERMAAIIRESYALYGFTPQIGRASCRDRVFVHV